MYQCDLQGGDKLTLALGGPNSTSATFIADGFVQNASSTEDEIMPDLENSASETNRTDKVSSEAEEKIKSKERCTTPVTVTHFSLNEKNGVVEKTIMPSPSLAANKKPMNLKLANFNFCDLDDVGKPGSDSDRLNDDKTGSSPVGNFFPINNLTASPKAIRNFSNNPFANPFKSDSLTCEISSNPFQIEGKTGANPFLGSSNPFIGSPPPQKDALSSLSEDVKTQMEILSKDSSKKVHFNNLMIISLYLAIGSSLTPICLHALYEKTDFIF